ncbi:MAG: hypothetical protein ACRDT2_10930 [Natronosporangium sp.]
MTKTYTVRARRWSGGWELHIGDIGVTQVATLARADAQVRDYLATLYDIDTRDVEIDVVPELGGLEKRAIAARERAREIEQARRDAAREARDVARELRKAGLSVSDTAAVLKVSRGRVSQLVS